MLLLLLLGRHASFRQFAGYRVRYRAATAAILSRHHCLSSFILGLALGHFLEILDSLEHRKNIDGVHLAKVVDLQSLSNLRGHSSARLRYVGLIAVFFRGGWLPSCR